MTIHATIHAHTQCTRVRAILRAVTQEIKMKRKCVWCFFRCGDITPQHFDVWRLSLDFFQRGLSLWFLGNLYYYHFFSVFFFFVFLFLLKTGRKIMMTMFWSGEKARKKSLFIILGYFVQEFRLSQATVLMKSTVMATSLTNLSMQSFWARGRWMK